MKKILAVILAVALILVAGTIGVVAARGNKGAGFADENNDGVCDNRVETSAFADADSDGICDNFRKNSKYTDSDDGMCDNRGEFPPCQAEVAGEKNPMCKGEGFADEDADGVCDNAELTDRCDGTGKGNGRGACGGFKGGNCMGNSQ